MRPFQKCGSGVPHLTHWPRAGASPCCCWTYYERRCHHSWWPRCTTCPEAIHPGCLPSAQRRALPTGGKSRCPAARLWGMPLRKHPGLRRSLWRLMWHRTAQPAPSSSPPCSTGMWSLKPANPSYAHLEMQGSDKSARRAAHSTNTYHPQQGLAAMSRAAASQQPCCQGLVDALRCPETAPSWFMPC